MPEITEQELLAAQRALQLIHQLANHPEAKPHLERGLKAIDPRIETSEEQVSKLAAPYEQRIAQLEERLAKEAEERAAEAAKRAEEEALSRLNDGFARLRKEGLTAEGEEELKKLMMERSIPDPEAAYALFLRMNPPPPSEPAAYQPQSWQYETDLMPDAKAWFTNPDAAEDAAIGQVLLEMRRGQEL